MKQSMQIFWQRNRKLIIITAVILLAFVLALLTLLILSGENNDGAVIPTPVPTVVNPTVTVVPTSTPLVPVTPTTSPLADYEQFVLSNCQVRMYIPEDWISSPRGALDACGVFWSLESEEQVKQIELYEGIFLAVAPFVQETALGFDYESLDEMFNDITRDIEDLREDEDFLFEQDDYFLDGQAFTYAKIERPQIGLAEYVFYNAFGRDYFIMWGGREAAENPERVNEILGLLEFLQPSNPDVIRF